LASPVIERISMAPMPPPAAVDPKTDAMTLGSNIGSLPGGNDGSPVVIAPVSAAKMAVKFSSGVVPAATAVQPSACVTAVPSVPEMPPATAPAPAATAWPCFRCVIE
jgi:hypothetical protein